MMEFVSEEGFMKEFLDPSEEHPDSASRKLDPSQLPERGAASNVSNSQTRCTTCEMQVVLASAHPQEQQTLPPFDFSAVAIPVLDLSKFTQFDWSGPLPVTRLTLDEESLQRLNIGSGSSASNVLGARSREMVPVSYHRNQLRQARQRALSNIGVPSYSGEKKLLTAVRNNDMDAALQLLSKGVNPNSRDSKKRTPLHIAASQGFANLVSLLLSSRADPNQQDILGNTPLHLAACRSDACTVRMLIDSGASIHLEDKSCNTPLSIVKSRLNTLRRDKSISASNLIRECQMISDMLKLQGKYLRQSETIPVDALCNMMQNVSTREQADEVADVMISQMSNLNLDKEGEAKKTKTQSSSSISHSIL